MVSLVSDESSVADANDRRDRQSLKSICDALEICDRDIHHELGCSLDLASTLWGLS
jgi:hypothetical protein